jgi:hypothetical protein
MLKYLRIGVTALSLTACVLLIALWVRSYFLAVSFQLRMPVVRAGAQSANGGLLMWIAVNEDEDESFWMPLKHKNVHDIDLYSAATFRTVPIFSNSNLSVPAVYAFGLQVPHWFMVILSVAIAFFPWMRWRFSLRTLLIATMLVAVGLGLVVISR